MAFTAAYVNNWSTGFATQTGAQDLKLTVWLNGRGKFLCLESTYLRHIGFGSERLCRNASVKTTSTLRLRYQYLKVTAWWKMGPCCNLQSSVIQRLRGSSRTSVLTGLGMRVRYPGYLKAAHGHVAPVVSFPSEFRSRTKVVDCFWRLLANWRAKSAHQVREGQVAVVALLRRIA